MKGPYERLKYTLRRVWECPECKHRERTEGWETHFYCRCQRDVPMKDQVCMKMVKDGMRRIARPKVSKSGKG